MQELLDRQKNTPDTRKKQLLKKAKKHDFDINQKIYGVFAYWQQPGCYGCYLLTPDHAHATKTKKKEIKLAYGDYDSRGFLIEHDTVENLMLKYTDVSVEGISTYFTFPEFLDKFEQLLQKSSNEEDHLSIPDLSGQLLEIDGKIGSIISEISFHLSALSQRERTSIINRMTSIKTKIDAFTDLDDDSDSSIEW